jgi:hypothetical protein
MRFCFTIITFLLLLNLANAQVDTTQGQWRWGISVHFGGYQTDFTQLRKYQYLLNEPVNFSQRVGFAVFGGNRQKIFIGIPISYSVSGVEHGSYNGYSIQSSGIYGSMGVSGYYPIYKNYSGKVLRGIYPNIGGQYSMVMLKSEANGAGIVASDTSFLYEKSRAHALIFTSGIMVEFGNLAKEKNKHDLLIVGGGGYNYQLTNLQWSGTPIYRDPGDENPDVNLGGFYFYVGINYWYKR